VHTCHDRRVTRRQWILFVTLAAAWGAPYLFIKVAIRDLEPATLACARLAIGAAVLLPLAGGAQLRALRRRLPELALLGAVEMAGPLWLIGAGERHLSSSLTGVLVASAPLFVALLALRFDAEERSGGARLAGLVAGILGVSLLLGLEVKGSALSGAMVLLAAFGYGVGALWLKRFSEIEPVAVMGGAMAAAAVLLAPAAALQAPSALPAAGPLASTVVLGVICTAGGFALFARIVRSVGASRASTVAYVAPVFSVLFGTVFLGEHPRPSMLAGLALILAGSWMSADGRLPRPGTRRRVPGADLTYGVRSP
jgi:drug/metabolite transporter (DMT)-like permease